MVDNRLKGASVRSGIRQGIIGISCYRRGRPRLSPCFSWSASFQPWQINRGRRAWGGHCTRLAPKQELRTTRQQSTIVSPNAQFLIPADASLQERQPRTLKQGDTFAVFGHNGDVISGPRSPEGIYHQDTRYLSHLYLTIEGERPMLLSSTVRDDNATMTCDLTNPDLHGQDGALILEHDLIHIRRSRFLWRASCFEHLSIRNFDALPRRVNLEISFHADFADLFEVRGAQRRERGTHHPSETQQSNVTLAYSGLDGQRRETHLRFYPRPHSLSSEIALFELDLAPGERCIIFLEICCGSKRSPSRSCRGTSSSLCEMRVARSALRSPERPRSRPPTRSSTRLYAAACQTCTCS